MLTFECDYNEGCFPEILDAFSRTNLMQEPGYGEDSFTASAKDKIRLACKDPQADVYFLVGGTQTNQVAIDTLLAPYEGVIAAQTGHINVHEAGAIEFCGHKVLAVPSHEGKVKASDVEECLSGFYANPTHEHMVFPGMVYLTHPSEFGTLYSADELEELADICHRYDIKLYLDGARLAYGLAADDTDVDLPFIARTCDAFYIGGTKVGALCGEALVFPRGGAPKHFLTQIKQHGALVAKGRVIGLQFDTLFTNDLYMRAGRHGIKMAKRLHDLLQEVGLPFFMDSKTNQQFVIVPNTVLEKLHTCVGFDVWDPVDKDHTVIRFATSWATTQESLDELRVILEDCLELHA